jgi:hypothetical protein
MDEAAKQDATLAAIEAPLPQYFATDDESSSDDEDFVPAPEPVFRVRRTHDDEAGGSSLPGQREVESPIAMITGDGGSVGSGGGGDDDDDEGHDAWCGGGGGGHDDEDECHGTVVPSSGLRKPYERGPSTLPTQKPLPHQRKVIAAVGKV